MQKQYAEFVRLENEYFKHSSTTSLYALNDEVYRLLNYAADADIDAFVTFLQSRQPFRYTCLISIPPIISPEYPRAAPMRLNRIQPWQVLLVPTQSHLVHLSEGKRHGYDFTNPFDTRINHTRLYRAGFCVINPL